MSNGNGHHYSKFVWQDHLSDEALNACSIASQGMWMRVLAVAHKGTPVGYVTLNGNAPTWAQLAGMLGRPEKEVIKCVTELETNGVCSRTTEGILFSRRMVRDAAASAEGAKHIAKRWGNGETHPPPNRGASREPTGKPTRGATADPITQSLESKERLPSSYLKGESLSAPVREADPPPSLENRREPPTPEEIAAVAAKVAEVTRSLKIRGSYAPGVGQVLSAAEQRAVAETLRPAPKALSPEHLAVLRRRAGYGPAASDRSQLRVVS